MFIRSKEIQKHEDKVITIPFQVNVTKLAKEVYMNFPEAAACYLKCLEFNYGEKKLSEFKFIFPLDRIIASGFLSTPITLSPLLFAS